MIVFPIDIVRAIKRLACATRVPLLFLLRDARHGIVTRDNLRERDQIIAAITFDPATERPTWRVVSADLSASLTAAAVASGVASPDPDPFAELDDTANDFAHVEERPDFLCPRCRSWSEHVAATWSNAPAANPDADRTWALCPPCFVALKTIGDPNTRPTF